MKPINKPTMREVAERLGISHSTVSRALRDDPHISEPVRLQVRKIANQLGYKRDPKLAELMTHLRKSKEQRFQGTLAWINNLDETDEDQQVMMAEFQNAAEARAAELGYKLDVFSGVGSKDAPRLSRIFRARNIQGVWCSMFWEVDYDAWKWDWKKFAFIHHGAEPKRRIVDVVDAEDRQNMQTLFEALAARGYQRIGIATTEALEREALYELTAGRLRFALRNPAHPYFPPCLVPALDDKGAARIAKWIKQHKVDCIVSRWRGMRQLLGSVGYRVPEDIGLAYVTVRPQAGQEGLAAGIDVNAPLIASTAIETLVSAVEQRRFGLPQEPRQTLVPGHWRQGATCRGL